jgi:hypothetical protein
MSMMGLNVSDKREDSQNPRISHVADSMQMEEVSPESWAMILGYLLYPITAEGVSL